jgi:hypothetical protein
MPKIKSEAVIIADVQIHIVTDEEFLTTAYKYLGVSVVIFYQERHGQEQPGYVGFCFKSEGDQQSVANLWTTLGYPNKYSIPAKILNSIKSKLSTYPYELAISDDPEDIFDILQGQAEIKVANSKIKSEEKVAQTRKCPSIKIPSIRHVAKQNFLTVPKTEQQQARCNTFTSLGGQIAGSKITRSSSTNTPLPSLYMR